MKSAEEWRKQIDFKTHDGFMADIRAIQADALRHALALCINTHSAGWHPAARRQIDTIKDAIAAQAAALEKEKK